MLQRIDPEAVAIGQRYPVLVTVGQVVKDAGIVEGKVAQGEEIRPLVLRMRIIDVACAKIALAGARVARDVLQLRRPDTVLQVRRVGPHLFAATAEPGAEAIVMREVLEGRFVYAAGVDPVETGVVEDDVEDNIDALLMRGIHQLE